MPSGVNVNVTGRRGSSAAITIVFFTTNAGGSHLLTTVNSGGGWSIFGPLMFPKLVSVTSSICWEFKAVVAQFSYPEIPDNSHDCR